MELRDDALAKIVESWFGRRAADEAIPAGLSWLPPEVRERYAAVSPLLWRERSVWQVQPPMVSRFDPSKAIFMAFDDGEWAWALDVDGGNRIYDLGPDEDEWRVVDASLGDLIAQRNLLEIAYGPLFHREIGQIPKVMLATVVDGLSEVSTCPWRSLAGLHIYAGEEVLVVATLGYRNVAPFDLLEDCLNVRIAALDPGGLDYIHRREWPQPWRHLPRRRLDELRDCDGS